MEFGKRRWRRIQLAAREFEESLEPIQKRGQLRGSPIVRTAPDNGFARMKQKIQDRLARGREIAREGDHVTERRIRWTQPPNARHAELPEDALGRVGSRRPGIQILQAARQPAIERGRDRNLEYAARTGPSGA